MMWNTRRLVVALCLLVVMSSTTTTMAQENTTAPSLQPSEPPSLEPSSLPTPVPTNMTMTDMPTTTPTAAPFANTTAPTVTIATSAPTMMPSTLVPTAQTTNVTTTETPTTTPTANETAPPVNDTAVPTMTPSTAMPTNATTTESPTLAPTQDNATIAPTGTPTMAPTSNPTMSIMPTSSTKGPTGTPTTPAPTTAPAPVGDPVVANFTGLAMTLVGMGKLDNVGQSLFVDVTREFYKEIYPSRRRQRQLLRGGGRRNLQVVQGVTNLDTIIKFRSDAVNAEGNTVTYDQDISYTSTTEANALSVIVEPFNDPEIADLYVESLKERDPNTFADLTSVEPPEVVAPPKDDDDGLSIGAIIGICAGGLVLVCLGGYLFTRSGSGGSHEPLGNSGNEPPTSFNAALSEEVSTMDDPNINRAGTTDTGSMLDVGDQSVATVDYDYSKAYGGADNSVVSSAGGTMGENTREAGSALHQTSARAALGASFDSEGKPDANVREEVIEINAPAGKLGVVIDTPDEGAPVVHAVKDSSVIADLIQVGDKLVAVDDEDVTAMTAIKVSKLISKKSANPSRKLTVIRQVVVED